MTTFKYAIIKHGELVTSYHVHTFSTDDMVYVYIFETSR